MTLHRTTLNREAYKALRQAILGRRIPPGQKLVVRVLAEELGLSPTPVKEALAALEREGLVVAVPHRGYFVLEPSLEDVREIYSLREVLEGLAARLAVENDGKALLKRLERLFEKQREAAERGDMDAYGDLDLAFHRTFWEAAGSKRLLATAETIDGQIRMLINSSAAIPGRLPQSRAEHQAILQAVRDKDPQAAEAAMRTHVRNAGQALEQFLLHQAKR
ncbi:MULTISPECIES: GntR family transcriptional regulator [Meiothermus]|jgi:DNA-binding GntR family transcriptional regulator|uniref:GntR family transcriptional regulator n=1 Tax=Meiothermus ruber (strain ATCC 35948 / DSM 1279 / VKM B-1258 / 21) TaxID=504728 RepID=D3PMA9_MEIRD|nr:MULTISPECIES: GntR family transcriptional regulator [Meiothermus]ADD29215.1 transcriptional regulator, GntR family [Meiothermus ruber DSM 1279]AGK05334.1 GntR family transcriptional regulator [Meiothermus ruber DSM 1279]KIQ54733.1 GntR family transcriptional regulator [Meiothermus taiwanensis]MCL6531507.1 GntR family transcriptional regulator [Meiothermus ruber]